VVRASVFSFEKEKTSLIYRAWGQLVQGGPRLRQPGGRAWGCQMVLQAMSKVRGCRPCVVSDRRRHARPFGYHGNNRTTPRRALPVLLLVWCGRNFPHGQHGHCGKIPEPVVAKRSCLLRPGLLACTCADVHLAETIILEAGLVPSQAIAGALCDMWKVGFATDRYFTRHPERQAVVGWHSLQSVCARKRLHRVLVCKPSICTFLPASARVCQIQPYFYLILAR